MSIWKWYDGSWKVAPFLALLAIALALVAIFALFTVRTGSSHENGHSVGTLINVRTEGVFWPRPAATLVHTGEMKGDEFGLDPSLFALANEVADKGERVKVTYASRWVCWAWNYSSCTFITAIEPDPLQAEAK